MVDFDLSTKLPSSPATTWLSNHDGASPSRNSSERKVDEEDGAQSGARLVSSNAANENARADRPDMSYPFDENLFYSIPTQLETSEAPIQPDGAADLEVNDENDAVEELVQPPDFRQFFTLIEDPETGEHHHPTVHYVFSDDDPEILTTAALSTLDKDRGISEPAGSSIEVEDRCVIVDLAADGKTVTSLASMSSKWQALKASIAPAPSWGEDTNGSEGGLMLRIRGQHSEDGSVAKEKKSQREATANLDDLATAFNERLERLDSVLGRT